MSSSRRTIRDADYRPMIRDLPTTERPRERLRDRGPASPSNAELLAILLRTGTRALSALDMALRMEPAVYEDAKERLTQEGIYVTGRPGDDRCIYFDDPDGHRLQLLYHGHD